MSYREIEQRILNDVAIAETSKKVFGLNCFSELGITRMTSLSWLDDAINKSESTETFEKFIRTHLIYMTDEVRSEVKRYCKVVLHVEV